MRCLRRWLMRLAETLNFLAAALVVSPLARNLAIRRSLRGDRPVPGGRVGEREAAPQTSRGWTMSLRGAGKGRMAGWGPRTSSGKSYAVPVR
jgi:hypothetical protein